MSTNNICFHQENLVFTWSSDDSDLTAVTMVFTLKVEKIGPDKLCRTNIGLVIQNAASDQGLHCLSLIKQF